MSTGPRSTRPKRYAMLGYTRPMLGQEPGKPLDRRARVLFLCRHNAVRSQMAEAILRARFPDRYEAMSAGVAPAGVHPLVLRVLDELGIPTASLRSKHVEEFGGRRFDVVATVCGRDEPTCPFFPGGRQIHHAFADPSAVSGSDAARLDAFRETRDEIDAWIRETFGG